MSQTSTYRMLVMGSDAAIDDTQRKTIFAALDEALRRKEVHRYSDTEILLLNSGWGVAPAVRWYARREAINVHPFVMDWGRHGLGARIETLSRMVTFEPRRALCFPIGPSLDVRTGAQWISDIVRTNIVDL